MDTPREPDAIPCSAIRFLMDRTHIGTPCRDVALDIFGRIARSGGHGPERAEVWACQALIAHRENGQLYTDVVQGRV